MWNEEEQRVLPLEPPHFLFVLFLFALEQRFVTDPVTGLSGLGWEQGSLRKAFFRCPGPFVSNIGQVTFPIFNHHQAKWSDTDCFEWLMSLLSQPTQTPMNKKALFLWTIQYCQIFWFVLAAGIGDKLALGRSVQRSVCLNKQKTLQTLDEDVANAASLLWAPED